MKKLPKTLISAVCLFLFSVIPASAHVIVIPKEIGIAQTQEFSMSVPTEKDTATVGIQLMIPHGVKEVTPNVKPGWTINVKKNGDDVSEIDWTGGSIPPEQRDDFLFRAQAPATETTLKWKAIQIYQDGSTVAWIHDPTSNPEDDSAPPPYSTTKVVNDLTGTGVNQTKNAVSMTPYSSQKTVFVFSIAALALSALALGIALRKK